MIAEFALAAEPEEILADLLGLNRALRREAYDGERSIVYNPGGRAPLGTISASIKDRDGQNDNAANLSRPPRGGVVDVAAYDLARIGELTSHPVYAWLRWVQILSPTRKQYQSLRPLLLESLGAVKVKWQQRTAG
jgi:hypothetical protein